MTDKRDEDVQFPAWLTKKNVLILLLIAALYANIQQVILYIIDANKPPNAAGIWDLVSFLADKPYMTITSTVFILGAAFILVLSRRYR